MIPPKQDGDTYVQIGTDEDNLALEIGLAEVTNGLLGHGGNHARALALRKEKIYIKIEAHVSRFIDKSNVQGQLTH